MQPESELRRRRLGLGDDLHYKTADPNCEKCEGTGTLWITNDWSCGCDCLTTLGDRIVKEWEEKHPGMNAEPQRELIVRWWLEAEAQRTKRRKAMSNHNRSSSEQRMVGRRKLEPRADCKRCPVRSGVGGKLVESTAARRAQSEEREAKRAEIPPISAKLHLAVERINAIAEEHKPIAVFGLFSGGNDSLAAIYATSLAKGFSGAVHVNTGIGVEETRNFVRRTCAERGWKLLEYKALENRRADGTPDPMDYEAMCLAHGFPGPAAHQVMYVKLKERQLARLERDMSATPSRPLLYVTGARSDESKRRMGNVEPFRRDGRRLWLNAIHDWSSADCAGLRLYAGLKQNEASSPTESA